MDKQDLHKELQAELKTIRKLSKLDEPSKHEEYREPLEISKTVEYKILLSWGGPSDGFTLRFKDNELIGGVYWFADWGTYDEVEMNDDEAEEVYQFYMYGDIGAFNN